MASGLKFEIFRAEEIYNDTMTDQTVYGGFWIRAAAALVDTVLVVAVLAPLAILWQLLSVRSWRPTGAFVVLYALPAIITLVFWSRWGATPGKRWLGLRIVRADQEDLRPGLGALIGRYAGYWLSFVCLGLGYFWVGWDRRKQGFHDRLAGTVVVRTASPSIPLGGGLAILAATAILVLVGGGLAARRWLGMHQKQFMAASEAIREEARKYGATHSEREILSDAMRRSAACRGFTCQTLVQIYLREALRQQKSTSGFCGDRVPPLNSIMATGLWRAGWCKSLGRTDAFCAPQMQAVQEHCLQDTGRLPETV
jgi:uncharacterized RDD family membrane protein YckC